MENSDDPFNIYHILNNWKEAEKKDIEDDDSLKHPPGYTPQSSNCGGAIQNNKDEINDESSGCCEGNKEKGSGKWSSSLGYFKVSEVPRTGGSMVGLLEEVVKVGHVMGFKMEGSLQETKMGTIDDCCVTQCWGNMAFDYVYSEAVGFSGGKEMMIIAVYAPQDSIEKNSLWGFLHYEISKWNGDVIIMGDFNEVRVKSDRFGSYFNSLGVNRFNSFILKSGLIEVNLGGGHFTWCHKSGSKMSKLDRLLVSKSIFSGSPNITAIQIWNKSNMGIQKNKQINIRKKLADLDSIIDNGHGNDVLINSRLVMFQKLQKLESLDSKERAQKAKIKWAVEGDENSGFFHGIINKRRNIQSIRGIMVDGIWIKNPTHECGVDKAPGPDGFTFGFYRHFWYLIESKVFEAVRFGFGVKWRKWIHCCLHSSKGSIIINGSPTDEFQFGKGLKQGDLLSPFLFLLVMESLHISFQRIVNAGMYQGIKIGGLVNLSHMFYADDAVFVGEWSDSNISTLIHVLDCFHKAVIEMEDEDAFGWRLTLIKSVLGSMPIFHMSMFKVPSGILRNLESIRGKFFNGHEMSSNKASWTQWNKRFLAHDSSLWSRVVKAIHGVDGNIDGNSRKGVNTCWTRIINEVKVMKDKGIDLMAFTNKKIRNGMSTSFWDEVWCEGGKLKDRIPRGGLEMSQVEDIGNLVSSVALNQAQDRWQWTLDVSGVYSVASLRNMLDARLLPKGDLETKWIR
nr:RNA-directed DNA polymerase, eukaryota [Tanacetum cinerariifolium]